MRENKDTVKDLKRLKRHNNQIFVPCMNSDPNKVIVKIKKDTLGKFKYKLGIK